MSWKVVLGHRLALGSISKATLAAYVSSGEGFEGWLKSKHGLSFDDVISGNSFKASQLVVEYARDYLGSGSESTLKHLKAIFRLCGKPLF